MDPEPLPLDEGDGLAPRVVEITARLRTGPVRLEAVHIEEIVDETAETIGARHGHLQESALQFGERAGLTVPDGFEVAAQGREGSPKLVRYRRDEVVLHPLQPGHRLRLLSVDLLAQAKSPAVPEASPQAAPPHVGPNPRRSIWPQPVRPRT